MRVSLIGIFKVSEKGAKCLRALGPALSSPSILKETTNPSYLDRLGSSGVDSVSELRGSNR